MLVVGPRNETAALDRAFVLIVSLCEEICHPCGLWLWRLSQARHCNCVSPMAPNINWILARISQGFPVRWSSRCATEKYSQKQECRAGLCFPDRLGLRRRCPAFVVRSGRCSGRADDFEFGAAVFRRDGVFDRGREVSCGRGVARGAGLSRRCGGRGGG